MPLTPKSVLPFSTPYPAPSTVRIRAAVSVEAGSYSTVALSDARFTFATETPSPTESAFSTLRAHAAQLIPVTGRETLRNPSLKFQRPPDGSSLIVTYHTPPPYTRVRRGVAFGVGG